MVAKRQKDRVTPKVAARMKISFSPPDITDLEVEEVCEALRSGWITTGPRTKKFEAEIAKV